MDEMVLQEYRATGDRADLFTYMHGYMVHFYRRWDAALTAFTLVASASLLTLVLASPEFIESTTGIAWATVVWTQAGLATATFLAATLQMVWRPASKAALHREAVSHYVRVKYAVSQALLVPAECTPARLKELQDTATWTTTNSRPSDGSFASSSGTSRAVT